MDTDALHSATLNALQEFYKKASDEPVEICIFRRSSNNYEIECVISKSSGRGPVSVLDSKMIAELTVAVDETVRDNIYPKRFRKLGDKTLTSGKLFVDWCSEYYYVVVGATVNMSQRALDRYVRSAHEQLNPVFASWEYFRKSSSGSIFIERPQEVAGLLVSVSALARKEAVERNRIRPNDLAEDRLQSYDKTTELLQNVAETTASVAAELSKISTPVSQDLAEEQAKKLVRLRTLIGEWLQENEADFVDVGLRTPAIAVIIYALTYVGVPPTASMVGALTMFGPAAGKEFLRDLIGSIGKGS